MITIGGNRMQSWGTESGGFKNTDEDMMLAGMTVTGLVAHPTLPYAYVSLSAFSLADLSPPLVAFDINTFGARASKSRPGSTTCDFSVISQPLGVYKYIFNI